MDEHEQGELVRSWLRQNGGAILGGVAIGLAGLLGWQWWQGSQMQHKYDAAATYQAFEQASQSGDNAAMEQLAGELGDRFARTPYATLALLEFADVKLTAGDLDGARDAYVKAAGASPDPALASLVHLRLARVELAAGKAEDALSHLARIPADDYTGLVAELRGDALMALGRTDEAGDAYQDALTALETGAPNRFIVEMKMADMGLAPPGPEA